MPQHSVYSNPVSAWSRQLAVPAVLGLALLFLLSAATPADSQTGGVDPSRYLILVVGPRSSPLDPNETGVVKRLNEMRRQQSLQNVQLATMHWDQPAQARLCQERLGIRRADLVAVALVELDREGVPSRSLGVLPRATAKGADSMLRTVTGWASAAGLLAAPIGRDGYFLGAPTTGRSMTIEGVVVTVKRLEGLSEGIWGKLQNLPIRSGDANVRLAARNLYENAHSTRHAMDMGHANSEVLFRMTMESGIAFEAAQPELTLPVELRPHVPALLEALRDARQGYHEFLRLRGLPTPAP